MWQIFLLNAVCGSTYTISKILLSYTPPILLMALRMSLGGTILLGYYYNQHGLPYIKRKAWGILFAIAFLGTYVAFICEFSALQYVSAAKTALLFNVTPFITALFAYFYFSERMTVRKLIGLLIGFLGFIPLIIAQQGGKDALGGLWFFSWPEIVIMISVVCYAYSWILVKKVIDDHAYSPLLINGVTMLCAGVMGLPTAALTEQIPVIYDKGMFVFWLLLIIFLGNIVFNNLYGYLLSRYSVTFLSFTGFTIPFFTAFYDYIFFGEVLTWDFWASSFIVGIGLYIFYKAEAEEEHVSL